MEFNWYILHLQILWVLIMGRFLYRNGRKLQPIAMIPTEKTHSHTGLLWLHVLWPLLQLFWWWLLNFIFVLPRLSTAFKKLCYLSTALGLLILLCQLSLAHSLTNLAMKKNHSQVNILQSTRERSVLSFRSEDLLDHSSWLSYGDSKSCATNKACELLSFHSALSSVWTVLLFIL